MSRLKHWRTKHSVLGKPLFPTELAALNEAMDQEFAPGNKAGYAEALEGMDGFVKVDSLFSTSDGYGWFAGLSFKTTSDKTVVIAIPWSQDWAKKSGTQRDRYPAVYSDETDHDVISKLLVDVTDSMKAATAARISAIAEANSTG